MQTTTTEKGAPKEKTGLSRFKLETKRIETKWDSNGEQLWSYFNEEYKKVISFFLSKKAGPRNLEIGGGWYQSYPGSTAIDVSRVCLKYNLAQQKVQYDLDYTVNGFKLPFKGCSFDSATMISVWQYLQDPIALLTELERVIMPGGEVYVINGQHSGVEGLVKGATTSEEIFKMAKKCGYDAMLQTIPTFDGSRDTFKSVCIAMPDNTLFGPVSNIKQKRGRVWATGSTQEFLDRYAEWEIARMKERLLQLKKYPITEYSRNYLETCERLSQKFHEKTGRFPILFAESHPLEVGMYVKDGCIFAHELMMEGVTDKEPFNEFARAFGFGFGEYYASARDYVKKLLEGKDVLPKVERYSEFGGCDGYTRSVHERDSALQTIAGFVASVPLNSHTKGLQQALLEKTEKEELIDGAEKDKKKPTINDRIAVARARRLYYVCHEYEQRRNIDGLIKRKNSLRDIETAGQETLDFEKDLPYFRKFILEIPIGCSDD